MKLIDDNTKVELEPSESIKLLEKHVVPTYDVMIDKLMKDMPEANLGMAVLALILAKHLPDRAEQLAEQLFMFSCEYAVYQELKSQGLTPVENKQESN
jgi:hypothetical protein